MRMTMMMALCLALLVLSMSSVIRAARLTNLCSEDNNYTAKSPFQSNLNALLASLSSPNALFFNDTKGQAPDRAYGLVLCRGDISLSNCSACLNGALKDLLTICPLAKQGTIWYDKCELRYSDLNFFSVSSTSWVLPYWNQYNVTDIGSFLRLRKELLDVVTSKAAYNTTRFATGIASDWNSQTIYGLAQCTRDLSEESCDQCLQSMRGRYPKDHEWAKGGRVLGQSCNFRYESHSFFEGPPTVSLNLSVPPPPFPSSMPPSPPPTPPSSAPQESKNGTSNVALIVIPIAAGVALLFIVGICFWKRSAKNENAGTDRMMTLQGISSSEWLSVNLAILKAATDNFSDSKELGRGGFGVVYKGTLDSGEDIAVKRLSASSKQGIQELKNELILVAKLQHKNLVRLRSACLEDDETLLVYEYVPNGSLDKFLFDPVKCKQLNWEMRFKIIRGITQGFLYLHEESHLKVVHRDLKASNVLLDQAMNPKISDFGLAKLFAEDETQHVTSRVVGTFGYIAPEYARRGHFSMKSDVYSFGILVLEIVTGKRCTSFHYDSEISQDILSYTWEHWINGSALEIIDPSMGEIPSSNEVLRCIQIALLCTPEVPAYRPAMSSVFLMLHCSSMPLQEPLQTKFGGGHTSDSNKPSEQTNLSSSEEFPRTLNKNEKGTLFRHNTWETKKRTPDLGFDRQTT